MSHLYLLLRICSLWCCQWFCADSVWVVGGYRGMGVLMSLIKALTQCPLWSDGHWQQLT
jgi:hypothetical protein